MSDRDSTELLTRYALRQDDDAFAHLVRRYASLVHGTALRVSGGRADLADDAAQAVFIQLAQKASQLLPRPQLGGWLHAVACTTTLGLLRAEKRRLARESAAQALHSHEPMTPTDSPWCELAPHLDAALHALPSTDRHALVGRYLEGKSTRDLAGELQLSPDALQKRISRALGRLRQRLSRRGLALSGAALATALAQRAEATVPEALAHQWTAQALTAGKSIAGAGVVTRALRSIRTEPWAFAAGVAAVAVVAWALPTALPGGPASEAASLAPKVPSSVVEPPRPPFTGNMKERDDLFHRLVAAAREPHPLARDWQLSAALFHVTPGIARSFILRGEAEFDPFLQAALFPKLFGRWAEAEPDSALDYALSSGIDARLAQSTMGFVYKLVWQWIERDQDAVGDWLARHWGDAQFHRWTLQGGMGGELATSLTSSWTREGRVDRALDFLERLPPGPNRDAALDGVADDGSGRYRADWPADRVAGLLNVLAARVHGPLGPQSLRRSVARWAASHGEEARRWIDALSEPDARFAAELGWLSVAEEEILVSEDKESGRSSHTFRPTADREERADRALEAAKHLPTEAALISIVEQWSAPEAAAEWLQALAPRLPTGAVDRALVTAAVQQASSGDRIARDASQLQKAFEMCGTISDAQLREDAISGLVRRWSADAPQQAAAFLAKAEWPPERLARCRALISGNKPDVTPISR